MIEAFGQLAKQFAQSAPVCDSWQLRLLGRQTETVYVRQNILQPLQDSMDCGAFIHVNHKGRTGYGATANLSVHGLVKAAKQAAHWCQATAGLQLDGNRAPISQAQFDYVGQQKHAFDQWALPQRIEAVRQACERLKIHDDIADWHAFIEFRRDWQLLVSSDGGHIQTVHHYIFPGLSATAHRLGQSQERTGAGWGTGRQGGLEQLVALGFAEQAETIAAEALQLLDAPPCPDGIMDLLLTPSQMMLQIHESIGHPLELDRILGDERNYAGTSFVSPDMFGSYTYGSPLLNVTFDPSVDEAIASYPFDDDGSRANKTYIIKDGKLLRPLGGSVSQARTNMDGVACARACHWNRPPIDRMANLNVEPGDSSWETLLLKIENGIIMDTNRSWSIDDSRNKFQFGCEWARLVKNGEPTQLVRNPNYRGISANFWRNLAGVGNRDTVRVYGTPSCGKGEPNQMIQVGHGSPACLFTNIDIFGGS